MGVFEMVVAIVAVGVIGSLIKARINAKAGIIEDEDGNQKFVGNQSDNAVLLAEIRTLKDRVAVLEKIATEDRSVRDLSYEIEKLRDDR